MAETMMKETNEAKSLDLIYDKKDENESVPLRYDISFYGADYLVDGIVRRLRKKDIIIPRVGVEFENKNPGFQRPFVWSGEQSDKFIESLLMGLPVPGIFLAQTSDGVFLVLDGQQRLLTLQKFYKNDPLGNSVQKAFRGKKYRDLPDKYQRRLNDSVIHATVVKQEKPSGYGSIYHIFERLNSGSKLLTPQQIRMALYRGDFADLLLKLNKKAVWRKLLHKKGADKTSKDVEMILRFFALFYNVKEYKNPMKDFLNDFMEQHQNIKSPEQKKEYEELFHNTISFINRSMGDIAFCGQGKRPSAAIIDSLMYGIARRLKSGKRMLSPEDAKERIEKLWQNDNYNDAINERTSNRSQVEKRLNLSENAF